MSSQRKVSQNADTDTNPMISDGSETAGAIPQSPKPVNGSVNLSGLAQPNRFRRRSLTPTMSA
jgi:hypothetical protein